MIGKNYVYKWLDFGVMNIPTSGIYITNVEAGTIQRDEVTDNANDHGSIASNTLESGRLFTFEGYCFGITKETRGTPWELLNKYVNIEPFVDSDPYYDLFWQTDRGENRFVKAKVRKKPEATNGLRDPRIKFVFELYAETNAIFDPVEQAASGNSTYFGGTSFANQFGDSWGAYSGGVTCVNNGNYKAGCEITITGNLGNPVIKNLTNGLEYKILGTTSLLVLDSRGGGWTVTDVGANIKYKRDYGVPILLSPGTNNIIVTTDSGTATVDIRRNSARNTY